MLGQIGHGIHYGIVPDEKAAIWRSLSRGGALQFRQNLLAVKFDYATLVVLPSVDVDHRRAALE
jgi:hypothetical protein